MENNKQEQIEEIAKYICNACEMGFDIDGDCAEGNNYKTCGISKETAEYIYNAGYRKGETISYQAMIDHSYIDRINELEHRLVEVRKETAKEILEIGKYCMPSGLRDWIKERYGAEVEE